MDSVQVQPRPSQRSAWWWIGAGGMLAALAVLYTFPPAEYAFYPACGSYTFLGIHCPGCGSLRALHHLTHGRWLAAVHANALLVLGSTLGLVWISRCRLVHGSWQTAIDRIRPGWIWWGGATVLLFGVVRNIPWFPFTWLAP